MCCHFLSKAHHAWTLKGKSKKSRSTYNNFAENLGANPKFGKEHSYHGNVLCIVASLCSETRNLSTFFEAKHCQKPFSCSPFQYWLLLTAKAQNCLQLNPANLVSNERSSNKEAIKFDARPQNMTPWAWGVFLKKLISSLSSSVCAANMVAQIFFACFCGQKQRTKSPAWNSPEFTIKRHVQKCKLRQQFHCMAKFFPVCVLPG